MAGAYLRLAALALCLALLPGCALPRWGNKEITLYDHGVKVFTAFMPADGKVHYEGKDGMKVDVDNRGADSPLDRALFGAIVLGLPQAAVAHK